MPRPSSGFLSLCVLLLAFLSLPSYAHGQDPLILSVTPTTGVPGTQVTVTGTGFGSTQGTGRVQLGNANGIVASWSDTQIVATVAPGARAGSVIVFQTGQSNGVPFAMTPPTITSLSPSSGQPGTQVTVAGSGFGATQGSGTVRLGSLNGTVASWSDTQIVATVVPGAATADASVFQNGVSSNGIPFYINPPTVTSVSPTSGVPGTQVTVMGSAFGVTQGSGYLALGTAHGNVVSWNDTQIVATVATGSTSSYAQVFQNGAYSNGIPFSMIPANITSVTPSYGPPGTQVTLTGSRFGAAQGSGYVRLGTVNATVNSWSDTQIVVTVAAGSGSGSAFVYQNGVLSNSIPFTSTPPTANITSVTPAIGSPGAPVTVVGTGFGATKGTSYVQLGSKTANVVSWSDTQIVATVASGALPGTALVWTSAGYSNNFPFPMSPANVASATPTTLSIGTQVTVTGSGFGGVQGSGQVYLGSQATPLTVTSWSDTQIVGTVAAGTRPGQLWVYQSGVNSNTIPITMAPAVITSMTPTTVVPGTQFTLTGSGFGATQGIGQIQMGSQATNPVINSWNDTQIVATVAAGTQPGSLWVYQNAVTSNAIPFIMGTPNITSVNPVNGPVGTQVTITGTGFGATQGNGIVYTLGSKQGNVVSWSDTQVVATVASGATSGSVVIRQNGVYSSSWPFAVSALNISGVSPASGMPGTQVTITGTGFGASQGSSKVWIGTAYGTVVSWGDTQVVASVAQGSQTGPVQVYQGGFWSNAVNFTIGPIIAGLSPNSGPVGAAVTITGTNFGATQGTSTVTFNGTAATPTSWSPTSITVPVPAGATSGNVVVTVSGYASNGAGFTVLPTPVIANLSPASGQVGTLVTITGTNFGATQGASTVSFNGISAAPTSWNDTLITVPVPVGATTGNVVVTVNGVPSAGVVFTVTAGPTISGISPAFGAVNATVSIVGTGFGTKTGSSQVLFNGHAAAAASWTDTQITTIVPTGATSGPITVTGNSGTSNGVNFTVLSTPAVSSLSPTSGPEGQSVTITGSGFGPAQGTSTVQLNGVTATATSWGDTAVVFTVPTGASSGDVFVMAAGVPSNALAFTVSPTITGIYPSSAAVGASVSIAGRGFGTGQGGTVTFNGTPGTVTSWANGGIVVTVPSTSSGNVVVSAGTLSSNAVPFTIVPAPAISDVSPTTGAVGTPVTINGTSFGDTQSGAYVTIGDGYGVITNWSDTQIQASVAPGTHSGIVQVSRGGVLSNAVNFTVITPMVAAVSPGSALRGGTVTISGSGFGVTQGSGNLWLGSTYGIVSSWSDGQIVASVASTSRSGTVKVLQGGVWSDPVSFTVTDAPVNPPATNISPSMVNLVVGDTFVLQALDNNGSEITGLMWASSDPTIVSLSADDPPLLTALATGHVTITAGDGTADVTVYPGLSLPSGTVEWLVPGDGSGVTGVVPAVPSSQGVADVFAFQQSGTVLAITASGKVAWTANLTSAEAAVPDFQGGLIVADAQGIRALDGLTGQANPAYPVASAGPAAVVPHTDGTIFFIDGDSLVGIDPKTGKSTVNVRMEHSTDYENYDCSEGGGSHGYTDVGPLTGQLIIAGDGFAYLPYYYSLSSLSGSCDEGGVSTNNTHLRVLRVGTDGSYQKIIVGDWSYSHMGVPDPHWVGIETQSGVIPQLTMGTMITNADQGATFSWHMHAWGYCSTYYYLYPGTCVGPHPDVDEYRVTAVSSAGKGTDIVQNIPGQYNPSIFTLQAADGSYFGPDGIFTQAGILTTRFDGSLAPSIATADGGMIATSSSGQAITLDQNGTPTGQMANMPTFSWLADWFGMSGSAISRIAQPAISPAAGYSTFAGGNPAATSAYIGTAGLLEDYLVFDLFRSGTDCKVVEGSQPASLDSNVTHYYQALKTLLSNGKYLASDSCRNFFAGTPGASSYLSSLTGAIERQVGYDGILTYMSQYDAGLIITADLSDENAVRIKKEVPVCGAFIKYVTSHGTQFPNGKTQAFAQTQPPATAAYINTKTTWAFTMSTMVHEALHNLTGKSDPELEQALGLNPDNDCATGSICISKKLASSGCAPDLVSMSLSPQDSSASVGGTQQFAVSGTFSDKSTQDLTSIVTWESSSPGVATVNSSGLATGVASGKIKITATFGSVSASTKLTITN